MNRKQREQNKVNFQQNIEKLKKPSICPNCKQEIWHGHFVVPSFREEGYFSCKNPGLSQK